MPAVVNAAEGGGGSCARAGTDLNPNLECETLDEVCDVGRNEAKGSSFREIFGHAASFQMQHSKTLLQYANSTQDVPYVE